MGIPGLHLTPAAGWDDISSEVETADGQPPLTYARPDGVGAFQLSLMKYLRGAAPCPSLFELQTILVKHVRACGLEARDAAVSGGPRPTARASAIDGDDRIDFWLVVDAGSFVLASYTVSSDADRSCAERRDCETMVQSIRVDPGA